MNVKRGFLGTNPNAPHIPIPQPCVDSKSIYLSATDVLYLFKDTRTIAKMYIEEILPQLCLQAPKEKLIEAFYKMPDNGWFEFDYATKVLSYCFLEKK